MSTTLTHPVKGRQVIVPDDVAESYISQGWVAAGSPTSAEPQGSVITDAKADEPSKKWNKAQLTAYAGEHKIDITDAKTNSDILALIVAAALRAETPPAEGADENDKQKEGDDANADTSEAAAVPADAVDGTDD